MHSYKPLPPKCAPCRILAGYLLILVVCRDLKSSENPAVKRGSAVHGRIWAPLGPSWNQFEPTCGQLAAYLSQHVANLDKLGRTWSHNATNLGTENIKNHWFVSNNLFHGNRKLAITRATGHCRRCRFVIMMANCVTHRMNMVAMTKTHLKERKMKKNTSRNFKRP